MYIAKNTHLTTVYLPKKSTTQSLAITNFYIYKAHILFFDYSFISFQLFYNDFLFFCNKYMWAVKKGCK